MGGGDSMKGNVAAGHDIADDNPKPLPVSRETFKAGSSYALLSSDGTRVLQATDNKSGRVPRAVLVALDSAVSIFNVAAKFFKINPPIPGGTSLEFHLATPENLRSRSSIFRFSSHKGYRLHSDYHNNKMLFMLGMSRPREWVVWDDDRVPAYGEWEVLEMVWAGARVKLKWHEGQYIKWDVETPNRIFVGTDHEWEATEFILREV